MTRVHFETGAIILLNSLSGISHEGPLHSIQSPDMQRRDPADHGHLSVHLQLHLPQNQRLGVLPHHHAGDLDHAQHALQLGGDGGGVLRGRLPAAQARPAVHAQAHLHCHRPDVGPERGLHPAGRALQPGHRARAFFLLRDLLREEQPVPTPAAGAEEGPPLRRLHGLRLARSSLRLRQDLLGGPQSESFPLRQRRDEEGHEHHPAAQLPAAALHADLRGLQDQPGSDSPLPQEHGQRDFFYLCLDSNTPQGPQSARVRTERQNVEAVSEKLLFVEGEQGTRQWPTVRATGALDVGPSQLQFC